MPSRHLLKHFFTGLLLLGAFFAQGFGSAAGAAALVFAGVVLEVWFWVRSTNAVKAERARKKSSDR